MIFSISSLFQCSVTERKHFLCRTYGFITEIDADLCNANFLRNA